MHNLFRDAYVLEHASQPLCNFLLPKARQRVLAQVSFCTFAENHWRYEEITKLIFCFRKGTSCRGVNELALHPDLSASELAIFYQPRVFRGDNGILGDECDRIRIPDGKANWMSELLTGAN